MISSSSVTAGTLPGTKTLPGRRGHLTNQGSTTGGRRGTVVTTRRSLKKARKETTGSGITAELLKKGTVGNEMIDGTTDKAGTSSTSIQGRKKKVGSVGGKGMDWCAGAAKKFTRRLVNQVRTFSIPRVASEKRQEAIRVKVQGKRSAKREGTKIKV
jgi:hypothetical protein